mgnify:FL=1
MKDLNEIIFTRSTLEAAMATNCTYYHGTSAQERFKLETPVLLDALDGLLRNSERVIDFGIGVGRLTKAILDRYPHAKVIGIDNSEKMLQYTSKYITPKHFWDGRIELYTSEQLGRIKTASIDLILAVYVLQHVTQEALGQILEDFRRVMGDSGKLYVLNSKKRVVPREDRIDTYCTIRRLFGFLERYSKHKQIQRLLVKLDNKLLLHDDRIYVQSELENRFISLGDIPLQGNPHMERLMRNHFSLLYKKRQE